MGSDRYCFRFEKQKNVESSILLKKLSSYLVNKVIISRKLLVKYFLLINYRNKSHFTRKSPFRFSINNNSRMQSNFDKLPKSMPHLGFFLSTQQNELQIVPL